MAFTDIFDLNGDGQLDAFEQTNEYLGYLASIGELEGFDKPDGEDNEDE